MEFIEYTDDQRRVFIDTEQLHQVFQLAQKHSLKFSGGMHWKTIKGKQYLFNTIDRYGNGRSLGPRTAETETTYQQFHQQKAEAKTRLNDLKAKMQEQSRFCKAARLQRVPRTAAKILRRLDRQGLLGHNVQIIGTNALYAYEAQAGVFLDRSITATMDMDVLWDIRPKITFILNQETDHRGFLELLKTVDRSFEPISPKGYRAVNRDGYLVDLLKNQPKPPQKTEKTRMGDKQDLEAVEIKNAQWLISSPRFEQVVIGDDGMPAQMVVPDPRAFALHKLWLSEQFDRDPKKKQRDYSQAMTVMCMVLQYLPHLKFEPKELRMFPAKHVDAALKASGSMRYGIND